MKLKTRLLIIVTGVLVLMVILTFWWDKRKKTINVPKIAMPTAVIIPTRVEEKYTSQTGAAYISPTDQQYREEQLIADLRHKCPIKNEAFSIAFDYKINLFVVKISGQLQANFETYANWMKAAGYDSIPQQYFIIN